MNNKILAAILIAAILVVAGYLLFSNTGAIVSAVGESVIDVQPDEVSVNLLIEARNESAQGAKEAHDELLNDLTMQLLLLGLNKEDIQTQGYNIYPEYVWDDGKQSQQGYVARHDIVVKTEDFDLVAEIVDAAVYAGSSVSYINFELSQGKENEYKAQALEQAGEDARIKAEATASGLGKKLGRLVSVQSQDFNYAPYRYYDMAVAESGGAGDAQAALYKAVSNISPSDIEVRASIAVTYKLRRF